MSAIGPLAAIRLERTARLAGHRAGSVLVYARQAFGVRFLKEVDESDLPDLQFYAENPPKPIVEKERRTRKRRTPKQEIARRVDRILEKRRKVL